MKIPKEREIAGTMYMTVNVEYSFTIYHIQGAIYNMLDEGALISKASVIKRVKLDFFYLGTGFGYWADDIGDGDEDQARIKKAQELAHIFFPEMISTVHMAKYIDSKPSDKSLCGSEGPITDECDKVTCKKCYGIWLRL